MVEVAMLEAISPLEALRAGLRDGTADPVSVARACAGRANGNASRNTYLRFDEAALVRDAEMIVRRFAAGERPALYGVPVSLKDCFDTMGAVTTCGSAFYERTHGIAAEDSWIAERLRAAGCLITGKTHLHPLAYGITGENPDYGDCLQPRDAGLLTGGSSSGAAASVQEGSALAAVGTDTGGSIRVPAALCGLVGWRCSQGLTAAGGKWPDAWQGGAHLAETFDTMGLLFRDPRDAPAFVGALFGVQAEAVVTRGRVGCVGDSFLHDCTEEVAAAYGFWQEEARRVGVEDVEIPTDGWGESMEIFAGIQAQEAAALHRGHYRQFERTIAARLEWGASLGSVEVAGLRERMRAFRAGMAAIFEKVDLLMLPCAPVSRLVAGADQSGARASILRYTTPVSLCGLPAIALPGELVGGAPGTGVQVAARTDGELLGWMIRLTQGLAAR